MQLLAYGDKNEENKGEDPAVDFFNKHYRRFSICKVCKKYECECKYFNLLIGRTLIINIPLERNKTSKFRQNH